MTNHTFKILQCEHRKISKVCLAILQHYAWKGLRKRNQMVTTTTTTNTAPERRKVRKTINYLWESTTHVDRSILKDYLELIQLFQVVVIWNG